MQKYVPNENTAPVTSASGPASANIITESRSLQPERPISLDAQLQQNLETMLQNQRELQAQFSVYTKIVQRQAEHQRAQQEWQALEGNHRRPHSFDEVALP